MVKGKLSVQEKRDIARKQIMEVSLELFLTKGFEATTTRDIIAKAGILNGSLYNRFKNKDEILISIIRDAIFDILNESESIFKKDNNLLAAVAFPGIFELYVASRSQSIARLIYLVHSKWEAVDLFIEIFNDWFRKFVPENGMGGMDREKIDMMLAYHIGSLGTVVGYYANGGTCPYEITAKHHLQITATALGMPVMDAEAILDSLKSILESGDLVFLGRRLGVGLQD